jgi:hypothetical protein
VEQAVHDRRAARVGEQFALVADQAARRRVEDEALAARPRGACRRISALRSLIFCTTTPECSSSTSMTTSSIGSRVSPFSPVLEDDARAAKCQLEAFAAHGLDQDAELQFAAAETTSRNPLSPGDPRCGARRCLPPPCRGGRG